MKLNKTQKELIEKALAGEVPKDIASVMDQIFTGKKKFPVPKTKINLTDTGEVITFTDHPINQFTFYLIKRFGKDFGLLYFSAMLGEKQYKHIQKIYLKNKWLK